LIVCDRYVGLCRAEWNAARWQEAGHSESQCWQEPWQCEFTVIII